MSILFDDARLSTRPHGRWTTGLSLSVVLHATVVAVVDGQLSVRRLLILLHRRLTNARVSAVTRTGDKVLLLWLLVTLLLGDDRFHATGREYLLNMTMLGGFLHVKPIDGVYWSLFVELQFYALVALLLALGQIRRAEAWLVLWLLATVAIEWLGIGPLRHVLQRVA